jgi:hypothetical protein
VKTPPPLIVLLHTESRIKSEKVRYSDKKSRVFESEDHYALLHTPIHHKDMDFGKLCIFPRRKTSQEHSEVQAKQRGPIRLTRQILETHFDMSLSDACKKLVILLEMDILAYKSTDCISFLEIRESV